MVFILVCVWNAKGQVCNKQSCLATRAGDWNESQANCLARLEVLSYDAPTGVTLQLPCMLHTCASFGNSPVVRSSREALLERMLLSFSSHTTLT